MSSRPSTTNPKARPPKERPEVDRAGTGGGDGIPWLKPKTGEKFTLSIAWVHRTAEYRFGSRTEVQTDRDGNEMQRWELRGIVTDGSPSTSTDAHVQIGDLVVFEIRERKPEGRVYEAAKTHLRIGEPAERVVRAGDLLDVEMVEAREKTATIDGQDITWTDPIYTMAFRETPETATEKEYRPITLNMFDWLEEQAEARTARAQARREQEAAEAETAGPNLDGEPF